jgi:hypothetical protein
MNAGILSENACEPKLNETYRTYMSYSRFEETPKK